MGRGNALNQRQPEAERRVLIAAGSRPAEKSLESASFGGFLEAWAAIPSFEHQRRLRVLVLARARSPHHQA